MSLFLDANLNQLTRRYWDGTDAPKGAQIIDCSSDKALDRLLRSHWIDEPSQAEIDKRDAVDYLIGYYSMLEVASLAGCIPAELPRDLATAAAHRLSRPAVARYYEKFYPLALPRLFLQRLQNPSGAPRHDAYLPFVRFLHVCDLREGDAVETFLWFLDDGYINGIGLSDVLSAISDPKKLIKVRSKRRNRTPLHDGVDGLLGFLQFARALDQMLNECDLDPVLRSAFWHYHGYWFQQVGVQLAGVLSATIENYRSFVGTSKDRAERRSIVTTHVDMNVAQESLRRMVSGIYSEPIDSLLLINGGYRPFVQEVSGFAVPIPYLAVTVEPAELHTRQITLDE